jgi:hypothetical protein
VQLPDVREEDGINTRASVTGSPVTDDVAKRILLETLARN